MRIFSGSNNRKLTEKVVNLLNDSKRKHQSFNFLNEEESIKIGNLKIDYFSDGEILPLFEESVRDQDVFLIQSTTSSDIIMETLLTMDAAKRSGCRSFTLVAPFQGYSRQDKTDHLRSSIGSKLLADIFEKAGMSRIITIDLHSSSIQGFYNVPVIHLNGNKIFIDYIKENIIEDLTILAPDQGAVKRASDFCKAFPEATFAMINKKRIKPNEIHSMELVGDVFGRNVVIVDDLVDTGGTLKKAAELIMNNGAKSVRAIATHGVLSGKAFDNIESSVLMELLVSDSILPNLNRSLPENIKYISCDKLLSKAIWTTANKMSIHEINVI
jgi:ribose-phosphate pyrophosphokinase